MTNQYAILELASTSDSILFHQLMNSRHKGVDITPKSVLSGTMIRGVTNFSKLPSKSYNNKDLVLWLRQFVKLSPEILYISSHHINLPPTPTKSKPSEGKKFYNDKSLAFEFIKDGMQVYSMVLDDKYLDTRITINGSRLGDRLVLLIMDGCNMHGDLKSSAAIELQNLLSSKTGKPIVLGFNGRSESTAQLYKLFLQSIPPGTDFSKAFARKTEAQNKLIQYWIKAGTQWNNTTQRKIMSAVDNQGTIFDCNGNVLKK